MSQEEEKGIRRGMEAEKEVELLRGELEKLKIQVAAKKDHNIVLMKREKTLGKFTGDGNVHEWIEECRVALEDRRGPEAVNFILQHLSGPSKREVKLHLNPNSTARNIFQILTEHFGQIGTFNETIQTFYARRQRAGEDLREYSYDLKEQLEGVTRLKPGCFPNPDEVLRDQFIAGIRDTTLRRELKERVAERPDITFMNSRTIALRWSADVPPSPSLRAEPYNYKVEADKELQEIKLLVKQQQETIAQLLKAASQQRETRACYKCHQEGHIARNCKMEEEVSGAQTPSAFPQIRQRGLHRGPRGRGRGRYHGRGWTREFGGRGQQKQGN